jgi:hypothetical protein
MLKITPKRKNNLMNAYKHLIYDEGIVFNRVCISTRKEFIEQIGKYYGYKNIKNILKEYSPKIKLELEQKLKEVEKQTIKLKRQLEMLK